MSELQCSPSTRCSSMIGATTGFRPSSVRMTQPVIPGRTAIRSPWRNGMAGPCISILEDHGIASPKSKADAHGNVLVSLKRQSRLRAWGQVLLQAHGSSSSRGAGKLERDDYNWNKWWKVQQLQKATAAASCKEEEKDCCSRWPWGSSGGLPRRERGGGQEAPYDQFVSCFV